MADTTDDDLMNELLSLGEQRQAEPVETEPEQAYHPSGPRLDAPMRGPSAGQFGQDLSLRSSQGDENLMSELVSLGNPTSRDITVTRPELSQSGDRLIDELTAEHKVQRWEGEARARDQSASALFGDWGKLDGEQRREHAMDWAKSEKTWTDRGEWFWTGVKGELEKRRVAAKGTYLEEDPLYDWLHRKAASNIGRMRERRLQANAIEQGEKEGPQYTDPRAVADWFATGLSNVGSSALYGLANTKKALENWLLIPNWTATDPDTGTGIKTLTGVEKDYLYHTAKLAEEWAKLSFPNDSVRQHEFKGDFAQGAGSMAAFFGPGLAARMLAGAGPMTFNAIAGGTGALSQIGSMTQDARKAIAEGKTVDGRRVDEDDVTAAFLLAVPIGASEAFPLAHLFRGHQGQWLKRVMVQAFEEGTQEFTQGIAENLVARWRYDDQREWDTNAWTGLAVGALLGAKTQVAVDLLRKARGLPMEGTSAPAEPETGNSIGAWAGLRREKRR